MTESRQKKIFSSRIGMVLLSLFCILLWSSAVPMTKVSYAAFGITEDASVFTKLLFAGIRFTLAGITVLLLGSAATRKPLTFRRSQWGKVLLSGLTQASLQYLFYYIGLSHSTGTLGSIMSSTAAFFVVLAAPLFYPQDRLTGLKGLGCVLGLAGIIVASMGGQLEFTLTGEGFLLLSAASNAASSLLARRFTQEIPPMVLTGWGLTLGGALLLIVGLAGGGSIPQVSGQAIAVLCYLFLLSAVAFSIWTTLLKYNDAGKVCIFNSLSPVFGTFLSILILNEDSFQPRYLLSLLLVCGGVYLVNRTVRRKE
ncbi:MAG TPA: DMT family transporter [Candidatus Pygmaiobacter gallistercoris]|nr:DMT family transporter [Candidatus Pygmaiobacter gallistercoris]